MCPRSHSLNQDAPPTPVNDSDDPDAGDAPAHTDRGGNDRGLMVAEVTTRRDRREFLRFEAELYRGHPYWVPPIWRERRRLAGLAHHPFYDDADSAAFLARRGGRVVGRIVAILNHAHLRRYDDGVGFFGFFECHDEPSVAAALIDAASTWLRRRGARVIRGPVHPSLNYEVGCLVDGFDSPPTFLIPYNHEYYDGLLQSCGLEKSQDLHTFDAPISLLDQLDPKLQFVVEESTKRFDVKTRPISRKQFKRDVRTFLEIYNASLEQTWGYVPMSQSEVDDQAGGLRLLLVPELTSIAEIGGRPVGAGFGLLDYNVAIARTGGRLFPLGWWTILRSRRHIKRLRMVSANVLPQYQRWGLGLVTLSRLVPDAVARGIEVAEFSWVLESNHLSRNTIMRGGATLTKTHRVYDRSL